MYTLTAAAVALPPLAHYDERASAEEQSLLFFCLT